jgi:tetratricopeptide (TPR) repeat protein
MVACKNNNRDENDANKLMNVKIMVSQMDSLSEVNNGPELLRVATKYSNLYPNEYAGWSALGGYYLYYGHNDSLAELYTKKSLSISANGFSSLHNMGIIYDRKKLYDSAFKYYKAAIGSNPNKAVVYYNIAENRYKVGDFESAMRFGEIAVKLNGSRDTLDEINLTIYYHKCLRDSKRDSMLKILADQHLGRIEQLRKFVGYTIESNKKLP